MLIITSSKVVLTGREDAKPATIEVDTANQKIIGVREGILSRTADYSHLTDEELEWIDAGDCFVFPGLVDSHVHLNEPGRTDWEGFNTGTRSAISGGVTTVVDMPLNSIPPTTTVLNLEEKRKAAEGQCWSDVAFWGGVIPGNEAQLLPLVRSGVKGFKCFLIESGVEEFPHVNAEEVKVAMKQLEGHPTVFMFHAELDNASPNNHTHLPPTEYSTFLTSRPEEMEYEAIKLIISLQRSHPNLRCHIVHLSASSALPLIRQAKSEGINLTVETTFHYLSLTAENIPHGRPEFKCCPPIRDERNRELLWEAVKDGTIDFVVSDHSPCVASLKKLEEGNIMEAWGGISGLGLGLHLLWEEGLRRGLSVGQISRLLSENPAKHAGLEGIKGCIAPGYDADFVIWNPDGKTEIKKEALQFKNKLSPYEGLTLQGSVKETILRGKRVWSAARGFEIQEPTGQLL